LLGADEPPDPPLVGEDGRLFETGELPTVLLIGEEGADEIGGADSEDVLFVVSLVGDPDVLVGGGADAEVEGKLTQRPR